jgi:hypothetical protein
MKIAYFTDESDGKRSTGFSVHSRKREEAIAIGPGSRRPVRVQLESIPPVGSCQVGNPAGLPERGCLPISGIGPGERGVSTPRSPISSIGAPARTAAETPRTGEVSKLQVHDMSPKLSSWQETIRCDQVGEFYTVPSLTDFPESEGGTVVPTSSAQWLLSGTSKVADESGETTLRSICPLPVVHSFGGNDVELT